MKRNSSNDAKACKRAPCSGHTIVTGDCPGSGGVPNTDAGKVASALLAKHVRTLEVLHSLQVDNAKLRRENQLKLNEDDVKRRVDEAVAEAIKGPNDISEELQSLIEGMRTRNSELEGELAEAKAASTKILDHAASQMEGLRAEIQNLKTKCADLQFEMSRSARLASRQGELESRLQDLAGNLAASESRTKDLAKSLTEKDAKSRNLELRVEERNQTILAMKTAEATLQSSLDENKARATALESESQELRRGLKAKEQEGDKLGTRLKEAVENIASLKKEAADMTAKEEALRAELEEERARANTAEMKATEERKRCHKLQGEGKQRLEEEDRKYKEVSMRYSVERQELFARIDALSRELLSLRAHLNSNRSQFSKYVEAKTENNQLKQEIDGLKEMIVAPRPPRRRHSHGSNATSIVGGLCSSKRHASVERLRHSISVARDHGNSSSNNSRSNIVVQRHHQEGTCNGNTSVAF